MVTAKLKHNPYLLETTIEFNGQAPRINSQVEKYESKTLQDWIEKIPSIFYDEMNGYDFDLSFVGTESDFADLKRAFVMAGVSEELVRLIHKNELESTETKGHEIDALTKWLKEISNRKFDAAEFFEVHGELFENKFPCIVIGGPAGETIHPQVGMEYIKDADELENTVLTNTPILFYFSAVNQKQMRENLGKILSRSDIRFNQLFFMIDPQLNGEYITRIIVDLGVEKPQIIKDYRVEEVIGFLHNYPMAEFIREAIAVFEQVTSKLSERLDAENKESEIQNAEIHADIDRITEQIARIKHSDKYFTERDNFDAGHSFWQLRDGLKEQINMWRNRKTKVVGDEECAEAARDYNADIARFMVSFISDVKNDYLSIAGEIEKMFSEMYQEQGLDLAYLPDHVKLAECAPCQCIPMADQFLALQEVTYEEAKKDRVAAWFRLADSTEEKELHRVVTCYYSEWRKLAWDRVGPTVNLFIDENIGHLRDYYNALAEAYHEHLTELLNEQETRKDEVSAQLSDDERKLQEDNDWLACFKDQLMHIKED